MKDHFQILLKEEELSCFSLIEELSYFLWRKYAALVLALRNRELSCLTFKAGVNVLLPSQKQRIAFRVFVGGHQLGAKHSPKNGSSLGPSALRGAFTVFFHIVACRMGPHL